MHGKVNWWWSKGKIEGRGKKSKRASVAVAQMDGCNMHDGGKGDGSKASRTGWFTLSHEGDVGKNKSLNCHRRLSVRSERPPLWIGTRVQPRAAGRAGAGAKGRASLRPATTNLLPHASMSLGGLAPRPGWTGLTGSNATAFAASARAVDGRMVIWWVDSDPGKRARRPVKGRRAGSSSPCGSRPISNICTITNSTA